MQELNCNQVIALLTFFAEKKLNPKLMQSIEYHLNICPTCREKYLKLQKILNNYQEIKNRIIEDDETENKPYKDKQYKIFRENLSAYIDNELSDKENLRIKKIAIANTEARQDLENILSFREVLRDSFQKTKNNLKSDLSELTVNQLYKRNFKKNIYLSPFEKTLSILASVLTIFTIAIFCLIR